LRDYQVCGVPKNRAYADTPRAADTLVRIPARQPSPSVFYSSVCTDWHTVVHKYIHFGL